MKKDQELIVITKAYDLALVPTLCVGTPSLTLRVVFSSQEPRPMGRSRYQFGEAAFPHFLTCTVVGWLPPCSPGPRLFKSCWIPGSFSDAATKAGIHPQQPGEAGLRE